MAATAKHFPGHGAVVPDSHVAMPVDKRAYVDMDEDLYPYRRLIDNGIAAVMMAHVVYEQVDARPASFSSRWIKDELRGKLGFSGAVFSDDLSMKGAAAMGDMPARVRAALAAGCDMVPICNDRAAVASVLALPVQELLDPVAQIRVARLHGTAALGRSELLASTKWDACQMAASRCLERPTLELKG
jgi:beta-N-acetylhexosaminidase